MVGITPIRSSPCSGWPSARAMSASSSPSRSTRTALSAIFWPERREADDAAGALDQRDAEQGLELAQAGRQRRLGDEAGFGRLAEMAVLAKRDQILQLLDGRAGGRSSRIPISSTNIISLNDCASHLVSGLKDCCFRDASSSGGGGVLPL